MKAKPTTLGLMGVIAFVAVGMAALRSNDELWAAVILALTVSALCTATLVAIYHRGAWAGFAVFGWAQFFICQPYSAPTGGLPSLPVQIAYRLLRYANMAPIVAHPPYRERLAHGVGLNDEGKLIMFIPTLRPNPTGGWVPAHSLRAGLCLSSIIVGFLGAIVGGVIARHSVARRDFDGGDRTV
jgi:hypothetical protein